jgi:2-oxoglutarate ferredoxin oxidoreductase subunit alpha
MKMTAKRREKIKALAAALPAPELAGDESGDVLIIGWGCTYGPIREAMVRLRGAGAKVGHLQMRHMHPLAPGLEQTFNRYKHVLVVEINDESLYGYGQLATLLRARFANPAIASITKTDGLTYKISEIVERVAKVIGLADTTAGMRKQSILASPQRS